MDRTRAWGGRTIASLALAGLLAGCGIGQGAAGGAPGGLSLSFEDETDAGAFRREGVARRDPPGGAEGLWAVVPDLPQPERARIEHLDTGRTVDVALFAGRGEVIRLSADAADAIGVGAAPVRVRVTALRRAARLSVDDVAF